MGSLSLRFSSAHTTFRSSVSAFTVFLLLLTVFSVPAVSESGDGPSRGMVTFYLKGQSTLSMEPPAGNTANTISIPRASILDPWPTVGEWSYTVPESRARVGGTVTYRYTLRNAGALPVALLDMKFILKGGGRVIKESQQTHYFLPPVMARTYLLTDDIPTSDILQDERMSLEIIANTSSSNVQLLYDSQRYDTSMDVDYAEANFNPVADAGSDISIREGETAELRGSGSDQDGYIVLYEWDFEGDGRYDWSSETSGHTSHRYSAAGNYQATLRVTDDDGATDTDASFVVVAENEKPGVSITNPNDGDTVNSTVTVQGTASDDGSVESVWVSFDGGMWHRTVGTENWLLNWDTTLVANGPHVISAKSNDSLEESDVQSVQVTVDNSGVNPRPTCSIVSITPNPAFKLDRVEFTGEGQDDGSISEWKWSSSIEGVISNQQDFSTTSLTTGNHTISLRVRDDNGSWSDSDSRLLVIKEISRPKHITDHSSVDVESSTIFDSYGVFWCAWSSQRDGDRNIYLKSSVNGVDWAAPINVTSASSSEREPSLLQLDNLTYVVAYASDIGGNYDIYIKHSRWGGYWSESIKVTSSPYDERHPMLYQRPDGRIFLAYDIDEPQPVGSAVRISHGNNVFSLSVPKTAATGLSMNCEPSLTEGPDGNVSVIFSSDRTGNYEIWKTVFYNEFNFSTPRRITYTVTGNHHPHLFRDISGMFRLVYSDDSDTVFLTESTDLVDFSESKELPTDMSDNTDPCILQDGAGNFWVTWDSDDYGNKDVYALSFSGNSPPHAVISSPADGENYFTSDTILFDGTHTTDPNGNEELDTFEWRSDKLGQLSNQRSFSRIMPEGMHNITLTVSDIHGASSTAEATITVTMTPNHPPNAKANVSDEGKARVGEELTFEGGESTDEDGDTLSYMWDFESDGVWDDHNKTADHAFDEAGSYTATLLVEDPSGANDTDTIDVTIAVNREPHAKIEVVGNQKLINVNQTIRFFAGNSSDSDDERLYYKWDFDGDGVIDSQSESPSFKFTSRGTYTVNLSVSDPFGANDTDSVDITVNEPPVAVLMGDVSGFVDEELSFDGLSSYDEDGDELTFQWDFESDGEIDEEGPEVTHIYESPGEYIVVLWVQDGRGGTASDEADLIIEIHNLGPVAEAGEDMLANIGEELAFDASASYDPDDDIDGNGVIDGDETDNLTYSWKMGDERTEKGKIPTHEYDEAGEYEVTLTVTDSSGAMDNDTLLVLINTPPEAVITLVNTEDIYEGDIVTLTAAASTDADEDGLSYSWDLGDGMDAGTEQVEHVYDTPGTYEITLTVDDDRGGNHSATMTLLILEKEEEVKLDTPSIEITEPSNGKKWTKVKITFTVRCSAEGNFIDEVIVTLRKGDEEVDSETFTEDFDDIEHEFTLRSAGDYDIYVELRSDKYPQYVAYDSVNVTLTRPAATGDDDDDDSGGLKIIPFLPEGEFAQYGGMAIIVLVILVAGYFLVIRRKRKPKTGKGKLGADTDVEELGVSDGGDDSEDLYGTEAVTRTAAAEPKIPIRDLIDPVKQPILCPKCGAAFEVEDYGERPLVMECPQCGTGGKTNTPVPPILRERIEKALKRAMEPEEEPARKEPKAKKIPSPAALAKQPTLPASTAADPMETGVRIRCPKCDKAFMTNTYKDITCPHCKAKGDIKKSEYEKLLAKHRATIKRLPPASEEAVKAAREAVREPVKKVTLDEALGRAKKEAAGEKVECPKCDATFYIEKNARKIKCPSCGVKGKLG